MRIAGTGYWYKTATGIATAKTEATGASSRLWYNILLVWHRLLCPLSFYKVRSKKLSTTAQMPIKVCARRKIHRPIFADLLGRCLQNGQTGCPTKTI